MLASNSSSEEFLTLEAVNNDETLAHSEKLVGRQQTPSIPRILLSFRGNSSFSSKFPNVEIKNSERASDRERKREKERFLVDKIWRSERPNE